MSRNAEKRLNQKKAIKMNTSATFTALEKVVFSAIVKENLCWIGVENFSETTIMILVRKTEISSSILRGVLSSLVQKNVLDVVDGFDGNDNSYRFFILKNQEAVTEEQIEALIAIN